MKKLLKIFLVLCLTTTAFSQYKPILGRQVNLAHPLAPTAGWLFNEGSGNKVFDLSGNGYDLTFNAAGNVSWTSGKFGPALNFPGVLNDYISGTIPELYRKPKTFVAWISREEYSNAHVIFSIGDVASDSSPQTLVRIQAGAAKTLGAFGDVTGNGYDYLDGTRAIADASWHQIVFVDRCDGAQAYHLYLDGIECTYSEGVPNNYQDYTDTANTLWLGTGYNNFEHEGLIDHFLIYDRELINSEIALLYQEPFCFMQEDMSVAQMYSYGAPPPSGGQLIIIQMSAIPLILIITLFSILRIKNGKGYIGH